MSGCSTTPAAFTAITIEGILDPFDPKDFDEEDIGNTYTNMRHPSPTATAGIIVPIQGINVSVKSQKPLIIASGTARHYESIGCDLKPAMMRWKAIKDINLSQYTLG